MKYITHTFLYKFNFIVKTKMILLCMIFPEKREVIEKNQKNIKRNTILHLKIAQGMILLINNIDYKCIYDDLIMFLSFL